MIDEAASQWNIAPQQKQIEVTACAHNDTHTTTQDNKGNPRLANKFPRYSAEVVNHNTHTHTHTGQLSLLDDEMV